MILEVQLGGGLCAASARAELAGLVVGSPGGPAFPRDAGPLKSQCAEDGVVRSALLDLLLVIRLCTMDQACVHGGVLCGFA